MNRALGILVPVLMIAAAVIFVTLWDNRPAADNGDSKAEQKYVLPQNITPGELSLCDYYDYKDLKAKIVSVSPSKRYAILCMYWKDDSWPYKFMVQDLKKSKIYELPRAKKDWEATDFPKIVSWSPGEDRILIIFGPQEAGHYPPKFEYINAYRITKDKVLADGRIPPAKDVSDGNDFEHLFRWEIRRISWRSSGSADIYIDYMKYVSSTVYSHGEPFRVTNEKKGTMRYIYDAEQGFNKIR